MSTIVFAFFLALSGCGSSDEAETATADAASSLQTAKAGKAGKKGKAKKGKGRKKGGKAKSGGKKRGKKGQRGGSANAAPLGEAGTMVGTLTLTEVESAPPGAKKKSAQPEGEVAAPAEAEAEAEAEMITATEALLTLAFGEGESEEVKLGKVAGTCAEVAPQPVGPEGKERTPLWTIECQHDDEKTELIIVQANDILAVLKSAPSEQTKGIGYRPVRRVKLAKGAEVSRGG